MISTLCIAGLVLPLFISPSLVLAQPWPSGGPGPYAPSAAASAAGRYAVGNPYARQLNELAVRDPIKHEVCLKEANERNLRREARWKFMIDCMKK